VKTATYIRYLESGWRFARAELAAVAALMVAAVGVLAFVEIADEIAEEEAGVDRAVLESLRAGGDPAQTAGPDWLHTAAVELTSLGDSWVLFILAFIVVGFLLIQKKPGHALLVTGALGGGALLSESLKNLFGRDRPEAVYRVVEASSESFPSGHAMLSAVAYLTLGVLLARILQRRRLKIYVLAVAAALTFIVGLTRVYLGVHWLTDVLAGWSLGAAWAMAWWLAAYAIERIQVAKGVATASAPE
jgi:undecaprenyl-diphosphatase